MNSNTAKISSLIETNTTVLDSSTGEVLESTDTVKQTYRVPKEPAFVKLYLDCLSKFKDVQISLNPILLECLRMATYSSCDEQFGGQILQLTNVGKQIIANRCQVSINRVNHALTEFVKKNIYLELVEVLIKLMLFYSARVNGLMFVIFVIFKLRLILHRVK